MGNDLLGLMKKGDILLVSEKGLKHAINRTLGRSRWHHVMLYTGKGLALEMTPKKGCHISRLDLTRGCYKAYKALRHRNLTTPRRKMLVKTAVRLFKGKKFSWLQLSKLFLRDLIGRNAKIQAEQYKCNTKRTICSNMISMSYFTQGIRISDKYAPEYIMPRDYDKAEGFDTVFERRLS